VELMVALAIVGLLLAVSVPGGMRFYESIQYRQSVRDVLTLLNGARGQSVDSGQPIDVVFDPARLEVSAGDEKLVLPEGFALSITSAREVNRDRMGVVRFYPEGGSSGGDITIESPAGRGVMISVDWLVGSVSQQAYDVD
jgi:general secretion pathway protein H